MAKDINEKYFISKPLYKAMFIERLNRFAALVEIEGRVERIFVPNSGRMRELLTQGAEVLLTYEDLNHRKTKYDLSMVKYKGQWVSIDSRLPNTLFKYWWEKGLMEPFNNFPLLKKEVPFGHSRLDFRLTNPMGDCYIEVKSVTLVEDGVAMFPDAPTERGSRHLLELAKSISMGYQAAVVFIIQRDDATSFKPHDKMDSLFGGNLRLAVAKGVQVYAFKCSVDKEGIGFIGEVPVILG